ncbi:nkapd1 [Pungitius sinensis]
MSKQTLGKTLLRNVIRHTDAHNKIQEETEMWKTRDWQVHTSHNKQMPDTKSVRGQMHCDRTSDQPRYLSQSRNRVSEHDDREARYWSRKLYEFEAGDPDRWGHSGFKELYPEEFESDSEKKVRRHKMKKSKSDKEASLSKKSKKSSRKKKKKKKDEEQKHKKDVCSSSDRSSSDSSATKDKQQRKKTKSRHKNKKTGKKQRRDEDSSSSDGDGKEERQRGTQRRKKRKLDCHKESDSGPDTKKRS